MLINQNYFQRAIVKKSDIQIDIVAIEDVFDSNLTQSCLEVKYILTN